jgi:hypothetical protein
MFTPGGWMDAAVRQIAYGMPLYNLLYVPASCSSYTSTPRSSSIP